MSRIFITGSADGLGKMTARLLIAKGHRLIVHGQGKRIICRIKRVAKDSLV